MTDSKDKMHRNDIYGDIDKQPESVSEAIPAATVVLLRDGSEGVETLMLHRTSKVHFGGMWVFPGGRIDPDDHSEDGDMLAAARNAAARETTEEAGIVVSPDEFAWFAHWTPPPTTPRRYATWFFATAVSGDETIETDGHEIQDHEWLRPEVALQRHAAGEIDLAPPTWITLHHVSLYSPASSVINEMRSIAHRVYETRIGRAEDGTRVAMWEGDAGYANVDPNARGPRHRLVMSEGGFTFEADATRY